MEGWGRCIVEVLKWKEPKEVVSEDMKVSRSWNTAGKHQDLWWNWIAEWTGEQPCMEGDTETGGWTSVLQYLAWSRSLFAFHEDRTLTSLIKTHPKYKPVSTAVRLETISLPSMQSTFHTLPESYHHPFNSSYIYLPVAQLLIAGGRLDHSEDVLSPSYILALGKERVKLVDMIWRVDLPLLVRQGDWVWCFGVGSLNLQYDGDCTDVQRLSLQTFAWTQPLGLIRALPSDHFQSHAELYSDKIYLFGGFKSHKSVDEFDTAKLTFRTLPIKISLGSALVGVRKADELYLIGEYGMQIWNIATMTKERCSSVELDTVWFKSSPAVLVKGEAFVLLYETIVVKVALETGECWVVHEGEV